MKKPLSQQEALYRVTALCAGCEQCEHSIREKLTKWGLTRNESDQIIDHLYNEKYIDELRFANAYARDKMRYNHWGRQKIDQGMRLLRISPASRKEALEALPEEEYLEMLQGILTSKARTVKADNDYQRNGKLIRFALGRGFEMGLIIQVLNCDDYEMPDEPDDEAEI